VGDQGIYGHGDCLFILSKAIDISSHEWLLDIHVGPYSGTDWGDSCHQLGFLLVAGSCDSEMTDFIA
jgi:hypothetical protein